jgi:hypothetical protein
MLRILSADRGFSQIVADCTHRRRAQCGDWYDVVRGRAPVDDLWFASISKTLDWLMPVLDSIGTGLHIFCTDLTGTAMIRAY